MPLRAWKSRWEYLRNVLSIFCTPNGIRRAITKNLKLWNTRKPELNDGRHQATPFLFLSSWGCVKEEPRSMKFTSRCQRRTLTHAHLQDPINDHLAQLFIPSILFMTLIKKFINSFFDG
jgi:hypothetical protein